MLTKEWIIKHQNDIINVFPQEWEYPSLEHLLKLGFQLKLNGINWTSNDELLEVMADLHEVGLLINKIGDNGHPMIKVNTDFKITEDTYGFAT